MLPTLASLAINNNKFSTDRVVFSNEMSGPAILLKP